MKKYLLFLLLSVFCLAAFRGKPAKTVPDFSLPDTQGKLVSMAGYPNARGFIIVFTCNHCPFAKMYPERLNALDKKYSALGVPLIAISSTDTVVFEEDTYAENIKTAAQNHYTFPYLYDGSQAVAKAFHADRTPHAFVLWKSGNGWEVKYNGAIDDNGGEPDKVKHPYVAEAVEALLKGETVNTAETKSIGCQIKFRKR